MWQETCWVMHSHSEMSFTDIKIPNVGACRLKIKIRWMEEEGVLIWSAYILLWWCIHWLNWCMRSLCYSVFIGRTSDGGEEQCYLQQVWHCKILLDSDKSSAPNPGCTCAICCTRWSQTLNTSSTKFINCTDNFASDQVIKHQQAHLESWLIVKVGGGVKVRQYDSVV